MIGMFKFFGFVLGFMKGYYLVIEESVRYFRFNLKYSEIFLIWGIYYFLEGK